MNPPLVVKVGGSLYDLPDLGKRLSRWLSQASAARMVVVPGGGPAADVIRLYARTHGLDEETAHWLALRMLAVNAHFLASLLPQAQVSGDPAASLHWNILDMFAFASADDVRPGSLPHHWDVTSDSLAVRVALAAQAQELVLLKSVTWDGSDWSDAARHGVVDACFPRAMQSAPGLSVRVVNLRQAPPAV